VSASGQTCNICGRNTPYTDWDRCERCNGARFFYVSAIDGSRRALVAGPYDTHAEALAKIDEARHAAEKLDPRAIFAAWGTAGSRVDVGRTFLGKL
jgi:hypothetical protein